MQTYRNNKISERIGLPQDAESKRRRERLGATLGSVVTLAAVTYGVCMANEEIPGEEVPIIGSKHVALSHDNSLESDPCLVAVDIAKDAGYEDDEIHDVVDSTKCMAVIDYVDELRDERYKYVRYELEYPPNPFEGGEIKIIPLGQPGNTSESDE